MMKRTLIGAIGLLATGVVSPVFGADAPLYYNYGKARPAIEATYDWSGFYIGLNGGGGAGSDCWDNVNTFGVPTIPTTPESCHNAKGAIAGGHVGYRWQSAFAVMGVEAQGDLAKLRGSNVSLLDPTQTNQTTTKALSLFTGQIGLAWQNLLWYAKGGVAVTNDKYSGLVTGTNILNDQASGTRWGGTIGTGLEIGFAPNWSVGVEYNHLFMANQSVSFTSVNAAFAPVSSLTRIDNVRQEVDMATVRVNYRFGGPVVAKY